MPLPRPAQEVQARDWGYRCSETTVVVAYPEDMGSVAPPNYMRHLSIVQFAQH